jgi:PAS domain S-box-containing protein
MATPRALVDSPPVAALLSLIAHADDPMLIIAGLPPAEGDAAHVIAANVSFCRLSGRSAAELIDRDWLTLIRTRADADAPQIDRVKHALARREHLTEDLSLVRADGLIVSTRCEILPLRDARGVTIAFLIIQRDLSEQKQTRDTLGSLRSMTRRASHDVNNGLASVIINLSLALSPRAGVDELRERIRDALDAARDAAETSKRLSELAKSLDTDAPGSHANPGHAAAREPGGASPQRPAGRSQPSAAQALSTSGSLLILDDDETVKGLLANYLGSCGYAIQATSDSDRCVELYHNALDAGRPFDLVILDLRIGRAGSGGLTTLAALRTIDPHVKAIAHSGYSTDDVMLNPRKFGFVAAIKKPTAPSEIAKLVEDLLHVHG